MEIVCINRLIGSHSLYTGATYECALSDLKFEPCLFALWYFDFYDKSDNFQFQYLGVMDIDLGKEHFLDATNKELPLTISPEASKILEDIESFLKEKEYMDYDIYFSGQKGFHVYVFHPDFFAPQNKDFDFKLYLSENVLNPKIFSYLDCSIYYKNKGIRGIYNEHPKTCIEPQLISYNRSLFPDDYTVWKFIRNYFYEDEVLGMGRLLYIKDMHKNAKIHLPPLSIEAGVHTSTLEEKNEKRVFVDIPDSNMGVFDYIKEYHYGSNYKTIKKKLHNIYIFDSEPYCLIRFYFSGGTSRVIHRKSKTFISSMDGNEYVKVGCHSGKCVGERLIIQRFRIPLTELPENLPIKKKIVYSSESPYLDKDKLTQNFRDEKWICLFSPMGSGKTQCLINYMNSMGSALQPLRILMVVTRRSQAINFKHAYNIKDSYIKFESYIDFSPPEKYGYSLFNYKKLIVSVHSLLRILPPPDINHIQQRDQCRVSIPNYDIIILDEIESILSCMTSSFISSTGGNQNKIYSVFACILKAAKQVVMMDGIPTSKTTRFLTYIGTLSKTVFIHKPFCPDRRYYIMLRGMEFDKKLKETMKSCWKIAVVSNTAKILKYYYLLAQENEGSNLIITGTSNDDDKMTVSQPNRHWKDVQRLFYNTAVGPGASYDALKESDSCFHVMFIVISLHMNNPADLYQLINRMRHLKKNMVYIYIMDHKKKVCPMTLIDTKRQMITDLVKFENRQNFKVGGTGLRTKLAISEINIETSDVKLVRTLAVENRLYLYFEDNFMIDEIARDRVERRENTDYSTYKKRFLELVRRNGGIVIDKALVNDSNIFYLNLMKNAREVNEKETLETIQTRLGEDNDFEWDVVQKKQLCALVDFNRMDYQYNFLKLTKALTGVAGDAKNLKEIYSYFGKPNRIYSNVIPFFNSDFIDNLKSFLSALGFGYTSDPYLQFEGSFTDFTIYMNREGIVKPLKFLLDAVMNEGYSIPTENLDEVINLLNTAPKIILIKRLLDVVKYTLHIFGVDIISSGSGNRKTTISGTGLRMVNHTYTINERAVELRLIMSGINIYNIGDVKSRKELIDMFLNNN